MVHKVLWSLVAIFLSTALVYFVGGIIDARGQQLQHQGVPTYTQFLYVPEAPVGNLPRFQPQDPRVIRPGERRQILTISRPAQAGSANAIHASVVLTLFAQTTQERPVSLDIYADRPGRRGSRVIVSPPTNLFSALALGTKSLQVAQGGTRSYQFTASLPRAIVRYSSWWRIRVMVENTGKTPVVLSDRTAIVTYFNTR